MLCTTYIFLTFISSRCVRQPVSVWARHKSSVGTTPRACVCANASQLYACSCGITQIQVANPCIPTNVRLYSWGMHASRAQLTARRIMGRLLTLNRLNNLQWRRSLSGAGGQRPSSSFSASYFFLTNAHLHVRQFRFSPLWRLAGLSHIRNVSAIPFAPAMGPSTATLLFSLSRTFFKPPERSRKETATKK